MITPETARTANHVTWPAGRPFHRAYTLIHGEKSFNPSSASARFRPIYDSGAVVPTAYGAQTDEIALAESVLRRQAVGPGSVLPRVKIEKYGLVKLAYPYPLDLIQLNGLGLRKLELDRARVIDTDESAYPATAQLAQVLYDANPDAHGIVWTSGQSDDGAAFILWETRLDPNAAQIVEAGYALTSAKGLHTVQEVARRLGVVYVP